MSLDPLQTAMANDPFLWIRQTERLAHFMLERVKSHLPASPSDKAEILLVGMFLRALAWMQSISQLASPVSFQAIAASNRSLLEILTDCALLTSDSTGQSAKTIEFWEESAKFKNAETLVNYFQSVSKLVPVQHKAVKDYYDKNSDRIVSERQKLWNFSTHPNRWTKHDLSYDIKDADQKMPLLAQLLGKPLLEVYRCDYQVMNWQIHGSGLTAIRNIDLKGIENNANLSRASSCDLALAVTKIIIDEFKLTGYFPEENDDWHKVQTWQATGLPDIKFSQPSIYPPNPLVPIVDSMA